jgi:hypothetical protein
MPQRPYVDGNRLVNPNRPDPDYDKMNRDYLLSRDAKARQAVRDVYGDEFSTPREIREQAGDIISLNNKYEADQERLRMGIPKIGPRFRDSAFDFSNRWNSSRTPDIKVGRGPRSGSTGLGSSGGGRGGGGGRGFKSGGIVKPKSFKKK